MPTRLRVFVTHPVQYHVPLWRELASTPNIDLKVFYFSDKSIRGGFDKGFDRAITWDVDLEQGYEHEFLARDAPLDQPRKVVIPHVSRLLAHERPNWVFFSGYMRAFERQLLLRSHWHGARLLMRGEFSDASEHRRGPLKLAARTAYLRGFYRFIDRFCYPGETARHHLEEHGVPTAKLFYSPYAVDDAFMAHQASLYTRSTSRRALGIPDDAFVFLFSGKLISRKNPLELLSALRQIGEPKQVWLIALGDGPLRAEFERQARELLGDRLLLPGFVNQSQLSLYFRASDILILPSVCETWGLVVNEAMHHGIPAIVSDSVGCHPNLIEHGVTGYSYPSGRTDILALHMRESLRARDRTAAMGRAAEKRIAAYTVHEAARGITSAIES